MSYTPFFDGEMPAHEAINQRLLELQTLAEVALSGLPTGSVVLHGAASAPSGYLLCDGSLVSRVTYAALFAAIGTAYGAGNGSSTFGLPDYRGRVPIGAGTGAGLSARSVGQSIGAETHQVSIAELPSHTHTGSATTAVGYLAAGANTGSVSSAQTGSAGADQPHNNMQPSLVVNFIIKT